ncbi:hypothetical protein D9757_011125 [Collybiopsis confluens]|uniref:Uncharacterized protein n=1 Tax=Collybiopsis confluens TaxID=2823264 RepID=A0A8H5GX39_9AGAR|nr:hypothetical protein D9757_011125 [Collybiopsis confluens]
MTGRAKVTIVLILSMLPSIPGFTNRLVSEILAANRRTVVINQSGSAVTFPWIEQASTVLQVAFYGGNELGNGGKVLEQKSAIARRYLELYLELQKNRAMEM